MNIAIIGASKDREKFGNKAVRAYVKTGANVFPVNLEEDIIEGLKVYKSVLEIKEPLDSVSLYLPPAVSISLVDDIAKTGVKKVYVNPGAESDELVAKLKEKGLQPLMVCSIRAVGEDPADF